MKERLTLKTRIPVPLAVWNTAAKGLVLRAKWGRGGTDVGLHTAKLLDRQSDLSLSKVLHIAKYFPRHAGDNLQQRNPPSNGWIAWLLWGGDAGRKWAERWKVKWERERGRE